MKLTFKKVIKGAALGLGAAVIATTVKKKVGSKNDVKDQYDVLEETTNEDETSDEI